MQRNLGGNAVRWIMAIICKLFVIQAIVFFIWVMGSAIDRAYAGPIMIGVALTLAVGELLLVSRRKA